MLPVTQRYLILSVTLLCAASCGERREDALGPSPSQPIFSLAGKVLDNDTGAGVAGATLKIMDGPDQGAFAMTDAAGNFGFSALHQGWFTVTVSAANYMTQAQRVILTSNQHLDFALRPPPATVYLTGRVTDATSGLGIAGAVVRINGIYQGATDASGNFIVFGLLDYGRNLDYTYVSADNYVADYRYIRGTVQNVRLQRTERITAGESRVVTVAPDDSLCVNNVQDTPGIPPDYVCRTLLVAAPSAGAVTIEARSMQDGAHPPLEVEIFNGTPCCSERLGNPTTVDVAAGALIIVHVEMLAGAPAQSFTVTTSPPR